MASGGREPSCGLQADRKAACLQQLEALRHARLPSASRPRGRLSCAQPGALQGYCQLVARRHPAGGQGQGVRGGPLSGAFFLSLLQSLPPATACLPTLQQTAPLLCRGSSRPAAQGEKHPPTQPASRLPIDQGVCSGRGKPELAARLLKQLHRRRARLGGLAHPSDHCHRLAQRLAQRLTQRRLPGRCAAGQQHARRGLPLLRRRRPPLRGILDPGGGGDGGSGRGGRRWRRSCAARGGLWRLQGSGWGPEGGGGAAACRLGRYLHHGNSIACLFQRPGATWFWCPAVVRRRRRAASNTAGAGGRAGVTWAIAC